MKCIHEKFFWMLGDILPSKQYKVQLVSPIIFSAISHTFEDNANRNAVSFCAGLCTSIEEANSQQNNLLEIKLRGMHYVFNSDFDQFLQAYYIMIQSEICHLDVIFTGLQNILQMPIL